MFGEEWNVKQNGLKNSLREITNRHGSTRYKATFIPRIMGQKITESIPITRVVEPKGASGLGYWHEARKKGNKMRVVRWVQRKQEGEIRGVRERERENEYKNEVGVCA